MPTIPNIIFDLLFIIVGIVLTPYIEGIRANISQSYKKRYEQKKAVFENTIQFVINNPQEEVILRTRTSQRNLGVILVLLLSATMMANNNPLLAIAGFFLSFIAFYGYYKANKLQKILDKVSEYKSKTHPDIDLDLYVPKKK